MLLVDYLQVLIQFKMAGILIRLEGMEKEAETADVERRGGVMSGKMRYGETLVCGLCG